MATALSMITRACRIARAIGRNQTLTAQEGADGLIALNAMLDSWQTQELFIYSIRDETFSWTGAAASRTVGAAGNFVTDRPVEVDVSSYFRISGQDFPVKLIDSESYSSLPIKTTTSSFPMWMFVDYTSSALVTLYVYPVPQATLTFHLRTRKRLQSFSALGDTVALPPGYQDAIEYSLAERYGPEFGVVILPDVHRMATEARANIQRANATIPTMVSEVAYMNRPSTGSNVYAGG